MAGIQQLFFDGGRAQALAAQQGGDRFAIQRGLQRLQPAQQLLACSAGLLQQRLVPTGALWISYSQPSPWVGRPQGLTRGSPTSALAALRSALQRGLPLDPARPTSGLPLRLPRATDDSEVPGSGLCRRPVSREGVGVTYRQNMSAK